MNLANIYLGSLSIITDKYIDENKDKIVHDSKWFKSVIIIKDYINGKKNYIDVISGERYESKQNYNIGDIFVDRSYDLISLDTILEQKRCSKKKVKEMYKVYRNFNNYEKGCK